MIRLQDGCSRRGPAGGIEGSVEVATAAGGTNTGLIDTLGLEGWLDMAAHPLLQFGSVALDPTPVCRGVRFHAALRRRATASRNEGVDRRRPRTAHRISSGSVCRHLKIGGLVALRPAAAGQSSTRLRLVLSMPSSHHQDWWVLKK